ncbi:methyltransferase [Candidatus Poribacteria bacterium]|nr:methyltransferase [Candidatus Poribacteria bacterium]MYH80265.1 methyltransferase [Candidatus Poribacteria bacterium]MYK95668.1 methyltransferase [Candidatus Poribacteria bacterium]
MAVDVPSREIAFRAESRGVSLTFSATWGLFSPKGIDAGTRLLLEHLDIQDGDTCLDLGCGYGAIGITLAKCAQTSTVYMVDKDFVAVDYARKNVAQNRLHNCHVLLSNGFSHLPNIQFDLIVSNLPANVGKELLQIFLADTRHYLKPKGRLYVVTISGLREFIKRNFMTVFGNYRKVKQRHTHTVAMAIQM